jgi:hypothetical protein
MKESEFEVQSVQFNMLDTQKAIPCLKSAIDELVQPYVVDEEEG